ncbi:MAG: efflux RND transporter permease subunit [Spirochaetia bacterium]|nr:efflux RND transporter permease subunit [Spirochaetia bacterium]
MQKIIEFFIHRSTFGNIITGAVIIGGLIAGFSMQREAFPRADFDIVFIQTVYLGASPQEVEKLVTIPIEREVKSIDGIKELGSTSLESRSAVVVQLEAELKEKNKVIQDIKDAVERAKNDFPEDVNDPIVLEMTSKNFPIIDIVLNTKPGSKKSIPELKLRELTDHLIENIEEIDDVAAVNKRGYRDREIKVEVSPDKLFEYNISVDEIIQALSSRNLNMPGGNVTDNGREYAIRTVMEFENTNQIENLVVRLNDYGGALRLKDIAKVTDSFEKKTNIEKANGEEAVILTVSKNEFGDALDLVDEVKQKIDDFKKNGPDNLEISTMNDMSFFIRRRLEVLQGNIILGIIMVLLSLLFFLGWRVSLMVAIGIPFSFALTMIVMSYFGISVNLISMFGLIIVSGMIVDDAIVVGENVYRHIERGEKPLRAAVLGTVEMTAPVTAAIATTIMAFLPLMFMGGMMGKFIWALPAAIIIALLASLFESFFILPAHIVDITKNTTPEKILKNKESFEYKFFKKLQGLYRPTLEWAINYRYFVIFIILLLFASAVVLIGYTKFTLFPKVGVETFLLKTEAPQGISLDEMNKRVSYIQNAILDLPKKAPDYELDSMASRVGIHQERPNDPFTKRGNNYAQFNVYLTPESQRKRKAYEIIAYLKGKINAQKPVFLLEKINSSEAIKFSNKDTAYIFNLSDNAKPTRNIKISDDFIIGGGILEDKKTAVLYSGNNDLILTDIENEKILKKNKIELKNYDTPVRFEVLSKIKAAILFTELGYAYKINIENGKKDLLYSSSASVTSFYLSSNMFILTNDEGEAQIWEIHNDGSLSKKVSIKDGPLIKKEAGRATFDFSDTESLNRLEHAAFSTDQKSIFLSTFDGIIYLYDIEKEEIIKAYRLNNKPVFWMKQDGQNQNILWFGQNNMFASFNLETSEIKHETEIEGVIEKHIDIKNGWYAFGSHDAILKISNTPDKKIEIINPGKISIEKIEFKQIHGGPPVGDPVSLEISGDEFKELREIAGIAKEKLSAIEGVYDIRDNFEEGKEEFHVQINEEIAALAGVTVAQIGSTLQAAFDGRVATSIKNSDEEIEIRVLYPKEMREKLSTLKKVKIKNRMGNLVPITELAHFKKHPGISLITHVENKRTIYVKANIDERKNKAVEVNRLITEMMGPVLKKYPGYKMNSGGEVMDTKESMQNLGFSALLALAGIVLILILLFGNLRNFRVITSAIPLGFIGVSYAFAFHKFFDPNLVFSFIASFGIVGLSGVVVNDSIVFVDFINRLRQSGLNRHDAIVGAGLHRLRPVMLTTITTVAGLLPTAYGIGGADPFLMPMALAMAWGLAFATLITLIVVPAFYAIWEDRGFVFHKAVTGKLKKVGDLK